MGEIMRNWIQARLGFMMDLSPNVFGHYTKDGRLLAQILYSYDVITRDQLDTIVVTHDPALCRVNMKHLRVWLRFLGIESDDESIVQISYGKGTAALRLFYKVYLCLETKDRLHFITLQKEREKFVPASKKFEVTAVNEDPPPYQSPRHPLSRKLDEGRDTVEWHRFKFPAILRRLQREKRDVSIARISSDLVARSSLLCRGTDEKPTIDERTKESNEANRFAREHPAGSYRYTGDEEIGEEFEKVAEDPPMAKAYVKWLKSRSKRAANVSTLKSKMQKELLSSVWDRMAQEQERSFDEAIASRVLDQSRYEKQMVTKLCEVREQKNIVIENKTILDEMTTETNETEARRVLEREKDADFKKQRDAEIECQRLCELMRRLREEKIRKLRERHLVMCRDTVLDMVNLVLKIEDYRRANDGCVPESILREWKAMFFRCQPIVDDEIDPDVDSVANPEVEERLSEEVSWTKLEKIEVLQDVLLDDYLETNAPWDAFAPMLAEDVRETHELGHVVLGYAVHRLLNYVHDETYDRPKFSLPKLTNAAIVLGISNSAVHRSIAELLENSGIRLVRIEDAINYCLERYKQESLDVDAIDAAVIAATHEVVSELRFPKHRVSFPAKKRFWERSRHEVVDLYPSGGRSSMKQLAKDKQTQTPRNLPFDDLDPVLSDPAYIGKWAYEFLALGEPITNELTIKLLLEYLKSLDDAKGWVIVDYPNTYEQMALLETTLTGVKVPPNPDILDFENVTIEDVESVEPRILYEDNLEPLPLYRRSRLVPNPIKSLVDVPLVTFAKLFVRVAQKPKSFPVEDISYETLSPNASPIDKFYALRNVAYRLYYSTLDHASLTALARLLIDERARQTPTGALSGEASKSFEGNGKRVADSKAPVIRRALPPDSALYEEERGEGEEDYASAEFQMERRRPRPGDPNWEWIEFPLPSALVECLASLWLCMEKMYTEDLKELLYLKSVHASGLVSYKDYLEKTVTEFIGRPCNKQDLLHRFHMAFNEVDENARHDPDVKCELHRRVADFQAQLWEICDQRRHEAEEERRRFVEDDWTVSEMIILFNVYTGIVQVELDRCSETIHLLQDYYLGMLKRPLQETRVPKIVLNRMQVGDPEPVNFHERLNESSKPVEKLDAKPTKVKAASPKPNPVRSPPAAPEYFLLRQTIHDLLIDRNKVYRDAEDLAVFDAILNNVRCAKGVVDVLCVTSGDILDKETAAFAKSKRDRSTESIAAKTSTRGQDLVLEWRYAFEYEIERVKRRLEAVVAAARREITFLLESVQRTFHRFYDRILDRYWQETKSVNDMANVFCHAIEEARFLEKEMLLESDRFVIRSNVYMLKTSSSTPRTVREPTSDSRFRIAQLSRLMEIFRRVAPHGTMPEKAFVYILQDLVSHGMEEGQQISLPCSWFRLRSADIVLLVDRLFESADRVDWREFIVLAMDLPIPTHRDILLARDRFRIQDQNLRELVTVSQFLWTPLWFLECTDTMVDVSRLLSDNFQRNCEELYEEEIYHFDLDAFNRESLAWRSSSIFELKPCNSKLEETLRLVMAKDLLCRMYMVDRHTVNYTALLLTFCKDEDPRKGFAKALALALGSRVCTDVEEGEKHVGKLYERRRVARRLQLSREASRQEVREVAEEIIRLLMDKVYQIIGWTVEKQSSESYESISIVEEETERDEGISAIGSTMFGESEFKYRSTDQETVVYWLSLDLCLTVLAATLPPHVLKPEILEPWGSNLRDCLTFVYRELRDEDLNDNENLVLAHRFLDHKFTERLLNSVGKFTAKNMGKTIREILRTSENVSSG